MGSLPRPAIAPGPQQIVSVAQEGCVDDPAAPPMRRCWPAAGAYADVVSQGVDVEGYGGKPLPANYVLWLRNARYVCERVMPEQCAAELGPVGCWYQMFPRVVAGAPTQAPAQLDVRAGADSGGGASDDGGGPPLGAVLGGVLGGVAFLAVVAAVLVVRMRQRRLSGGQHAPERHSDSFGAAMCAASACERAARSSEDAARTSCEDMSTSMAFPGAHNFAHAASAASGLALGARTPSDTAFLPLPPAPLPPSLHHDPSDPHSALVPVTRLTPLHSEVRLDVDLAAQEVTLLPVTRGKGSYGRVVEGMYGGQRVAVKLLDWGLAGAPQPEEGGPGGEGEGGGEGGAGGGGNCGGRRQQASQAALAQEVEVLGRCRHPNIVRLLAASLRYVPEGGAGAVPHYRRPPSVCLVMELCDTSLERLLYDRGPEGPPPPYDMGPPYDTPAQYDKPQGLPLETVLHIAIQVAQGLEYLHPTIMHRDLKPANVLVSNPDSLQPIIKLADFGLSRLRNTVLVTRHPEAGTAAYMAPETFDLKNFTVTDKVDMYSMAVMLWEMLVGAPPWYGWTAMQVAIAITLRGERLPMTCLSSERCPPKLRKLILACFETDPARRPAAAEAVKVLTLVQQEVARSAGAPQPALVTLRTHGPSAADVPPRCIGAA
ncbi:putative serine/threonine-protein kinase [Tetrabaena socialis]|uniref:Putative serine/threonine-protein kinase n=1 Tax=Tetrabaena socialis TaxID=47790 RepID=A0A2J8AI53_9CHLO|nr:putative serine/threonine-protein kinase [Tetrabaena socialis]|eukprot:PNH12194.1 putative serine/threonine-protein kinase [Tetrabaena socialis]